LGYLPSRIESAFVIEELDEAQYYASNFSPGVRSPTEGVRRAPHIAGFVPPNARGWWSEGEVMLYRIKTGSREYYLVRASEHSVKKIAREKIWQISPGEKVSVFRGKDLVKEFTRLSLLDEEDRKRFGLSE
jgi:hypothetical protein